MVETLFENAAPRPLAEILRPRKLSQVVGQEHLLGPNGPLGRMVAGKRMSSFLLWGPPGVGKTTIARLMADEVGFDFIQLSAVSTGITDLRKAIATAGALRASAGRPTVAFIDELHRFSRPVQDALLPAVEDGTIVLIGATTENPSFSVVSALLSRTKVYTLNRLTSSDLLKVVERAEAHVRKELPLTPEARDALVAMADGDARYLLGMCEDIVADDHVDPIGPIALAELVQRRAPLYDKGQEEHFNLLSSFHKSLRGSDPDAALYWAARMLSGGEEPSVIFRRLCCAASEDVGMADPNALVQVMNAWQAFERIGFPEGRLFLAQAINYIATAPKSNASYVAFDRAMALARSTGSIAPPKRILNAPTKLMKDLGYHAGYRYDHDYPDAFAGQDFFPDDVDGGRRPVFYSPNERGFERDVKRRLEFWSKRRDQVATDE